MKWYSSNWSVGVLFGVLIAALMISACGEEPAEEVAHFAVEIDVDESELDVTEGDDVVVVADIENTGDLRGIQNIEFEIDGVVDPTDEEVELDGGETETVDFTWTTDVGDAGDYTAEVRSDDDEDSADVTVEEGEAESFFAVSIDEGESVLDVYEGETVELVAEVTNTGEATDTQDVEIVFENGTTVEFDVAPQTLEPQEGVELTAPWETEEGHADEYTGTVTTDDDEDSTTITVSEPPEAATVSGTAEDAETEEPLEGVDVALYEDGEDDPVDTVTTDGDGDYGFEDLAPGDYDITLSAPGLNPDHTIDEADNGNVVSVSVDEGEDVDQDLTVDWLRETDLYVDGGVFEFDYEPDDDLDLELPGCEESDGNWEPVTPDDPDNIDVSYDPDDECFRLEGVGVTIGDGELDIAAEDVHFPEITAEVDDQDDNIDENLESATVSLETVIDDAAGSVDYTDGSLDIDMDVRFLVGGTAHSNGLSVDFGTEYGYDDCQLTGAWGGDVEDPADDDGDYLHDPIEISLTTGESGSDGAEGEAYDDGVFIVVDNALEIGRMSEGEHGADDPGGASCGYFDDVEDEEIDFAAFINDMLNLPNEEGDVLIELELLVP